MKTKLILALLTACVISSCTFVPAGQTNMGPPPGNFAGGPAPAGQFQQGENVDHGHQGGWAQKMTNGKPDGPPVWIPGPRPEKYNGLGVNEDQPRKHIPQADLDAFLARY